MLKDVGNNSLIPDFVKECYDNRKEGLTKLGLIKIASCNILFPGEIYYIRIKNNPFEAVKVLGVLFVNDNMTNTNHLLYVCETPGGGKKEIYADWIEDVLPTREDLENFVLTGYSENRNKNWGCTKHIFKLLFPEIYEQYLPDFKKYDEAEVEAYKYDKSTSQIRKAIPVLEKIWLDQNGEHLIWGDTTGIYGTRKECFDNEFVPPFDSFSKPKKNTRKKSVEINLNVRIKALNEEDALEILREKLKELD